MDAVISKQETIRFLIEKCYKNFPELIRMIPEDEMNMKLNKNIFRIITKDEAPTSFYGMKHIVLFGIENGDSYEEHKKEFAHEGIHALFRDKLNTGCIKFSKFCSIDKLKGIAITNAKRFKSKENIRLVPRGLNDINEFGRALNEGFTEWCVYKCFKEYDEYEAQVNIIRILECINGAENVLKIGQGDHKQIQKMFNMTKTEYNLFIARMDEFLFLEENKTKNSDIKKKNVMDEITDDLMEKLIIRHYKEKETLTLEDIRNLIQIDKLLNSLDNKKTIGSFITGKLKNSEIDFEELTYDDCISVLKYIDSDGHAQDSKEKIRKIKKEKFLCDFPEIELKIKKLKNEKDAINVYEIKEIVDLVPEHTEEVIDEILGSDLRYSELKEACEEFYKITNTFSRDEAEELYYFTEKNGFYVKSKLLPGISYDNKNDKVNVEDETCTPINFQPIEVKVEQKKTFLKKFIDYVIKKDSIMMEDLSTEEVINLFKDDEKKEGTKEVGRD